MPDRWGRTLMQRQELAQAHKEHRSPRSLLESDYLLGVHDLSRKGAVRLKLNPEKDFVDNRQPNIPPLVQLHQLEHLSLNVENKAQPLQVELLNQLVAHGSSLGGARPKAHVQDERGQLWVAKFPSLHDQHNVGAWEQVAHLLAQQCGIHVAATRLIKSTHRHHNFLSKRFDRSHGQRIHFVSAMNLLGLTDGDGYQTGVSYLNLAEFITQHGSKNDLEQLWRRIVFSIGISNTDDHLRNHGFLLTPKGWQLSPAYDLNPNPQGTGLALNISQKDNALSFDLACEVAALFEVSPAQATKIIQHTQNTIKTWPQVAQKCGLSKGEQQLMQKAFQNA